MVHVPWAAREAALVKVLFVCSGNICRSPTAEGVFRGMAERDGLDGAIEVDSAGTHAFHAGEAPDPRSRAAAAERGYDLSGQVARQVRADDFQRFDYILAMDASHHQALAQLRPEGAKAQLSRFLDFAPDAGTDDVPDPYYGGAGGFDHVLDLVEAGARGLIRHIRENDL
jgi:protein-tyrosine phosphatase